jgi:hypothetical protein
MQRKQTRSEKSPCRSAGTVLQVAIKKLIKELGAEKIPGFRAWSIAIGSDENDTARARFNAAYLFKMEKGWWILLPGEIENDSQEKYTRAAFLVPVDNMFDVESSVMFFKQLFIKTDHYNVAVWLISMSNSTFRTNDNAPSMGRFATKLAEATPVTGQHTLTRINADEVIIGSHPTQKRFSVSGRIQYTPAFADKLARVILEMMSMPR